MGFRSGRGKRKAPLPLEVRVAAADAIVLGRLESFALLPEELQRPERGVNAEAVFEVERALRGNLDNQQIKLGYFHHNRAGSFTPEVGERFGLLLRKSITGEERYGLVEQVDCAFAATEELTTQIEGIAATAAGSWRDNPGDLRAMLTSARLRYDPEENVELILLVQNLGISPVAAKRLYWPRETMTHTHLDITGPEGPVAAQPVPIAEESIVEFFSKASAHETTIEPGRIKRVILGRVNSAEQGYGYKAELGFSYYPMGLGTHSLTATLHNMVAGAPEIQSGPLELTLEPGAVEPGADEPGAVT